VNLLSIKESRMFRPIVLSASIALLLAACNGTPPSAAETAPPAAAATTTTTAPEAKSASAPSAAPSACQATDFDGFLARFENDVAIQKAYTTIPLESSSIDPNAEPEPKAVVKQLAESEITFPVMPTRDKQDKDGLKSKRTDVSPTEITVQLTKPDTDYQMSFHFRNDGCWHLYRVEDESL
jgi:hypothetical protein